MPNKKRILKSESFLSRFFRRPGEEFHVGILWEDYIKSDALKEYNLPQTFTDGKTVVPAAKGGATKANQKGKEVRKQPEEKKTRVVHISYVNKHGTHVEFDRDFNAYVKELLHKYNMRFTFKTNEHRQQVVISPPLTFTNEQGTNMMNTHAINLFLEVFGEFEVFDAALNPAIPFNKRYEYDFLPKGTLVRGDTEKINDVIDSVRNYVKDPQESEAFAKRLFVITEYKPDLQGQGPAGFFGYIVLGFKNRGIVILESMYKGDATYVFDEKEYEKIIVKSKQEILDNKLHMERFIHHDNWEEKVRAYMASFGVKDEDDEGEEGNGDAIPIAA